MYVHPPPRTSLSDALTAVDAHGWPAAPRGYLHWDKLRHLAPPAGFTREQWWVLTRIRREHRSLPLHDVGGNAFAYSLPDEMLRLLHVIDQRCAGEIASDAVVTSDQQARRRYLVNGLMEEAIRSSQLEGATTSRQVAKELLRSEREPLDRSERMIANNYRALLFMRENRDASLTPALVCELQRILTDGTLDDPDDAGRIQRPADDRVAVHDRSQPSVVAHVPPPAAQLSQRLRALCAFANGDDARKRFIHPVLRAILVHFQLAYDHPFADGNGRTARALFSWHMAKHGYWLTEYLSISRILSEAPSQYGRAFLMTETDGGDTTYFVLHQLHVIERAIDVLYGYMRRKTDEIRDVEQRLRGDGALNHRQLALLSDALREPGTTYTFRGHAQIHSVTHETARTDLRSLARRGLLDERHSGRRALFSAPADLSDRLSRVADSAHE